MMKNKKNKIFNISIIIFIVIIVILIIGSLMTDTKPGEFVQINYEQVLEKVENKEDFILVVSQSTCSHCATYKPKLKIIAKDYGVDVFYIDYDKESENDREEFLKEFKLNGATPLTLFFENGKEKSILNRIEGDLSSKIVIEKMKKMGFIE